MLNSENGIYTDETINDTINHHLFVHFEITDEIEYDVIVLYVLTEENIEALCKAETDVDKLRVGRQLTGDVLRNYARVFDGDKSQYKAHAYLKGRTDLDKPYITVALLLEKK
jgi:hypothetical protein